MDYLGLGKFLDYLIDSWLDIKLVVVIFILFAIYLALTNTEITINHDLDEKERIVFREGMETKTLDAKPMEVDVAKALGSDDITFCSDENKTTDEVEELCNKIKNEDTCLATECCMYTKEKGSENFKCVHGDNMDYGPIIQPNNYDYWYYVNRDNCGGECPKN